jgi:uncharacterized surface anchored protein
MLAMILVLGLPLTTFAAADDGSTDGIVATITEPTDAAEEPAFFAVSRAISLSSGALDPAYANSEVMKSLDYLGFDVQYLKDNNILFEQASYPTFLGNGTAWSHYDGTSGRFPSDMLADIRYNNARFDDAVYGFAMGTETVTDRTTVSGLAPDVATFEARGWPCLSYPNYYWFNWLPNMCGIDTSWMLDYFDPYTYGSGMVLEHGLGTIEEWREALDEMAEDGLVERWSTLDGTGKDPEVYRNLVPGDVIIFSGTGVGDTFSLNSHMALYAGKRDVLMYWWDTASQVVITDYFFIDMSPSGAKITPASYLGTDSSKATGANTWYHIPIDTKEKTGSIEVIKTDPNGKKLSGASFKATETTTNLSYTLGPTDSNGYAKVDGVKYGTYKIVETHFPDNYTAGETKEWTVTLSDKTPNGTITINAVNVPEEGTAKIVKETTNGGSKAGWNFTITDAAGNKVGSYTTDSTGVIAVGLKPGTYTVTETDAARDYWTNDPNPSRTVTIRSNETATVTFTNKWNGKCQIVKQTTNGGALAGWHFEVKNSGGKVIGTYETDKTGVIVVDLEPGTYTVTETDAAKEYWENDTVPSRTVTVKAGETAKVTFTNRWIGKGKIVKTATNGGTVEGWTFTVTNSTGTFVGKYTTDADGLIVADLEPGTYTVVETVPDSPYWICDTEAKTITVKPGETASVSFQNRYMGQAKIIKTLEDSTEGTVEGWTFQIKASDGSDVGTFKTDASGTILHVLEPGTYTVTEILEEDSYWECTSGLSQTITVKGGQTAEVTFQNALRPAEILVYKVDALGVSLADAEFLLEWSEDGNTWKPVSSTAPKKVAKGGCDSSGLANGKLVSGKDGVIHFTGLHPKLQYRLTETKAPEGYHLLNGPAYVGNIAPDETLVVELTVVNHLIFELPMTGSVGSTVMPYLQIAGAGVLLLLLLRYAKKRR